MKIKPKIQSIITFFFIENSFLSSKTEAIVSHKRVKRLKNIFTNERHECNKENNLKGNAFRIGPAA